MTKKDFSFPYKPYEIQLNLMEKIYSCIEEEKVGIFESPTGTGKSLSVLCSTLTWLEDFENTTETNLKKMAETKVDSDKNAKDWVAAYKESLQLRRKIDEAKDKLEELEKIKERIRKAEDGLVETRKRKQNETMKEEVEDEEDFGPGEYNSDQEDEKDKRDEESLKTVKIFYASRTHSQLEQLVDELGKTKFKPRLVTIASRQSLCANENVQKLKINHLINEKCMELRKNCGGCEKRNKVSENEEPKKTSKSGCPYYKQEAIEDLTNGIIARRTIRPSELTDKAKKVVGCPYFATRKAVPLCQLVLLPYQVLLHSATRAAWGVELEGNVVVLDEAHNVLQTIGNIHSCEISEAGLKVATQLVQKYIDTYRSRLKTKNLMYMRLLLKVVSVFSKYLENPSTDLVLTIQAFLIKLQLTTINLFKLVHYIESTDLCKKFHGFYLRQQKQEAKIVKTDEKLSGIQKLLKKSNKVEPEKTPLPAKVESKAIPSPLFSVKAFLEALNNKCEDGRIIVDKTLHKLRFILLNPADQLREVVDKSRATILIGGTMEPVGLLVDCLTKGRDASKLKRFTCEHVIDDNQLVALVVDKTVDGRPFSLTYQTRNDEQVLKSLGMSLISLIGAVPNGAVAFFTSYDVMNNFVNALKKLNLLSKLQEKKNIFIEPRAGGENVWDKFVPSARSSKGALLFAVAGGKMSEGINFSDELGRAVFMIGLPYPNKSSPELQENMKFMDGVVTGGGKLLYDSLCMHAVNQAIGRAIRHRNDYASVFLIDSRFLSEGVQKQLSGWISKRIKIKPTFSEVLKESASFFSQIRKKL